MIKNPPAVREKLRKEVRFGCPVPNCGNIILGYHHFDPTWAEENHNRTEGIIALCQKHHSLADGGHYTKKQLRAFKQSPYITEERFEELGWFTKKAVVKIGNGLFVPPIHVLKIDGQPILEMRYDENDFISISLNLFEGTRLIAKIEDNDITFPTTLYDIEIPQQQRIITVKPRNDGGSKFTLEWSRISLEQYALDLEIARIEKYLEELCNLKKDLKKTSGSNAKRLAESIHRIYAGKGTLKYSAKSRNLLLDTANKFASNSDNLVTLVEVTGTLSYGDNSIDLTKDGWIDQCNNKFDITAFGTETIGLQTGTIQIGVRLDE